jgi:hypothetical protein
MAFDQLQLRAIRENSHPLIGPDEDDAPLFDLIGNSRLVLIGEASHGTHEFYRTRAAPNETSYSGEGLHRSCDRSRLA